MTFKLKQSNIVSTAPINKIDMEDGVLGKANRDGTIDINKEITDPQQEREVIEHEKMHLEQMQRGDLDYDDKNVYWKGKKYPRSKMDEGAKNLPWEKEVYDRTENMSKNFKLKGPRGQSEPMSALSNRGLIKKNTMKVKIKPSKEGELSDYARDHVTKTNRKGKVTIEVPKSEMWNEKSNLFTPNPNVKRYKDEKGREYLTGKGSTDPAAQPTAKGFKRERNMQRASKAVAGLVAGGIIGSAFKK
tara:strand:+ start:356 stop:1090 length:735 start_codon:yes stop_codon:yes gene_type:complete